MTGKTSAIGHQGPGFLPVPGPFAALAGLMLICLSLPAAAAAPPGLLSQANGPVTVLHHGGDEGLAGSIAAAGADLHRRIRQDLDLRTVVAVSVYLLRDDYYGDGAVAGLPPPWIAGTADPTGHAIVLRLFPGRSSLDYGGTLAHELTHVILAADYPRQNSWPLWFREGLAMRQSGGEGFRHGRALFLSSLRGGLISLERLRDRFPREEGAARLAYAESYSVIAYLHSRYGAPAFRSFMGELRSRDFPSALRQAYGLDLEALEDEWRRYVHRRYSWVPLLTGASTFWFLGVMVFFLSLVARRRKTIAIRERWEEEDSGRPG